MPFKSNRISLLLWLALILVLGSFVTNLTSYIVSRNSLRESIIDRELPIISDSLYSEIQHDLVRPIFISSQMAQNTFLHDWVLSGEKDLEPLKRYLTEIKLKENTITSFFVSEKTRNYYYSDGVLKVISAKDPVDKWYFRAKGIPEPYEINVDPDATNKNIFTVFVNYRMLDYKGSLLGIAGVGISLNRVDTLVRLYERQYKRKIYFIDKNGFLTLSEDVVNSGNLSIREKPGIKDISNQILTKSVKPVRLVYSLDNTDIQVNSRYVKELGVYLLVEQNEKAALAPLNNVLSLNLIISSISTILVLSIILATVNRYQDQLEAFASTDVLTGLGNRVISETRFRKAIKVAIKTNQPLSMILFDIDFFKRVNDTHGHVVGDKVISMVASLAKSQVRSTDGIFRWGGEEFLVLLYNCVLQDAVLSAEKIRATTSLASLKIDDHTDISVTVSVGVGQLQSNEDSTRFLDRVDKALYAAKNNGRNRTEVTSD